MINVSMFDSLDSDTKRSISRDLYIAQELLRRAARCLDELVIDKETSERMDAFLEEEGLDNLLWGDEEDVDDNNLLLNIVASYNRGAVKQ